MVESESLPYFIPDSKVDRWATFYSQQKGTFNDRSMDYIEVSSFADQCAIIYLMPD